MSITTLLVVIFVTMGISLYSRLASLVNSGSVITALGKIRIPRAVSIVTRMNMVTITAGRVFASLILMLMPHAVIDVEFRGHVRNYTVKPLGK